MAKEKTRYVCTNCGEASLTWAGKCAQCGEWNTLQEEAAIIVGAGASDGRILQASTVGVLSAKDQKRIASGMPDVDLVLGGGVVSGSVNLIAGQPGIGKSTLLLQLADKISKKHKLLYLSGEEPRHQIDLRAE